MEENRAEKQNLADSEASDVVCESAEPIAEPIEADAAEQSPSAPKEEYVYTPAVMQKNGTNGNSEKKASAIIASLLITCSVLFLCVVFLTVALFTAGGSPGNQRPGPGGISGTLSVSDIAEECSEFTVAIQTRTPSSSGSVTLGTGSGIILTENGYIATNSHVVSGADTITVYTHDGNSYGARLIADDPDHDIALIRITLQTEKLATATVGDYEAVRVGDEVVAIGTPHSIDYAWTVSVGHISNVGREIGVPNGNGVKMIQMDVPVNPGNSGGPLINMSGEVIGIVSAKLDEKYEGINFAIPMSEYMDFFNSEIEKDMSKPQLGVVGFSVEADSYYYINGSSSTFVYKDDADGRYYIYESYSSKYYLTPEESQNVFYAKESGFLITEITENSDANGKLRPYDIITEFDGVRLVLDENNDPYETVVGILAKKKASDVVKVKYLRDGKERETQIGLKEKD